MVNELSCWYQNGEAVSTVSLDDRGLHYGDGIFETIAVRDGILRHWHLHTQRLSRGCDLLRIPRPNVDALEQALLNAVLDSDVSSDHCVAKVIVTAGRGERGYGRGKVSAPTILIGVFSSQPVATECYRDGVDTSWCRTPLATSSVLAGVKSLNRLEQVLARSEVLEKEQFEGLMMDANGNVISGTMSNVFFVDDGAIITPELSHCGVQGTMRDFAIAALRGEDIDVTERRIDKGTVEQMDEVFLSNSQFGVLPVRAIGACVFGSSVVTRDVMSLLADNGVSECRA